MVSEGPRRNTLREISFGYRAFSHDVSARSDRSHFASTALTLDGSVRKAKGTKSGRASAEDQALAAGD